MSVFAPGILSPSPPLLSFHSSSLTDCTYDVNWSMIQTPVVGCSGGGSIVCAVDGWGSCVIQLPSPTVNVKHSFLQSSDLPAIRNCHWNLNKWLIVASWGTPHWHTPDWVSLIDSGVMGHSTLTPDWLSRIDSDVRSHSTLTHTWLAVTDTVASWGTPPWHTLDWP